MPRRRGFFEREQIAVCTASRMALLCYFWRVDYCGECLYFYDDAPQSTAVSRGGNGSSLVCGGVVCIRDESTLGICQFIRKKEQKRAVVALYEQSTNDWRA